MVACRIFHLVCRQLIQPLLQFLFQSRGHEDGTAGGRRFGAFHFNITNSTSYDQYYVHGRTVFEVMVRITDDIFNTYLRKRGTVNPYYSEYCDGKSVTCPGLKQWGTVTLANNGRSALQILRYYYGSDIEIVRTSNIQSIPQSYPGSPLRQGDSGTAVFTLQRQLNRMPDI